MKSSRLFPRAYDQLALVHQTKVVLDESKKRLDANRKTADKALGYGLITPYDHKNRTCTSHA